MHQQMVEILLDAYAHPERGAFFYTFMGRAETGSERLNRIPYWDWNPQPQVTLPEGAPPCGTNSMALDFGCPPIITSEGREWCEPIIHDPAQVKDIEVPDATQGRVGAQAEYLRRVAQVLPEGHTHTLWAPLAPLGIAELMWDQSFYAALIEHPDAVHELLEKITEYIIRGNRLLHKALGPERVNPTACPPLWCRAPGYYISDDTMCLLSPAMHREYSVPYINCITAATGPVHYHSCTWRRQYFDNLHDLRNTIVFNWNPGNSEDPAIIMKEFAGQAVLAPHIVHRMHRDGDVLKWKPDFVDEYEFFKYFLDNRPDNGTVFVWFSNIVENGPVMERIYDLLHAEGLTPQAWGIA